MDECFSYRFCSDTIFYKDDFYAIDFLGHIYRIIRRGFPFKAVEFPKQPAKLAFVDDYLVELNGKLSLVQRFINSNAVDRFCVYNLDRERRTKVENIGDNVIILGKNSSKSVAAGRGFVANCVYFIDDAGKNMSEPLNCEAGICNIAAKHYEWFKLKQFSGLRGLNWFNLQL